MEAESKRDIRTSKVSVATFLPKTLFANASTARSPRPRRLSTGELTGPPSEPGLQRVDSSSPWLTSLLFSSAS